MQEDHQLVPVILPVSNALESRVHRPLFLEDPLSPVNIYFAKILENRKEFLSPAKQQLLNLKLDEIKATAMDNWLRSHQGLNWQQIHVPGVKPIMGMKCNSDVISSILLSHGHLKGMHKHYQSDMVHVAIPDVYSVYISDDASSLREYTHEVFENARNAGTQLCPNLYTSLNGEIKGFTVPDHEGKTTKIFNEEEQVLPQMQRLMAMSFFIMSGAKYGADNEGKFGDKEHKALLAAVTELASADNHLIHQAAVAATKSNFSIFTAALNDIKRQGPMAIMVQIQKLHDNVNRLEFSIMKHHIMEIASKVAAVSGGFLGMGAKSSEIEKKAIEALRASFSVVED